MASRPSPEAVPDDVNFQRRVWTLQRLGWAAMAGVLLLAALGLFGRGPLSYATIGHPGDGLSVHYERFVRYGSATRVQVRVPTDGEGHAGVALTAHYLDQIEIAQITPHPDTVESASPHVIFHFHSMAPRDTVAVTFDITPSTIGWLSAEIAQSGGRPITFHQMAFP